MGFYELFMFDQTLSVFTQRSIVRNYQSMRLNQPAKIKKWPVAAYSVRNVNSSFYNGPVMRLRRGDGALGDLYCNQLGIS